MTRKTRTLVLALVGSAGLLTCCLSSCVDVREEQQKDQEGRPLRDNRGHAVTHRRYYFRPWFGPGWGGGFGWGGGGSSYGPRSSPAITGTSGGGSRPTGTTTSRGGFGGTGGATSGG